MSLLIAINGGRRCSENCLHVRVVSTNGKLAQVFVIPDDRLTLGPYIHSIISVREIHTLSLVENPQVGSIPSESRFCCPTGEVCSLLRCICDLN